MQRSVLAVASAVFTLSWTVSSPAQGLYQKPTYAQVEKLIAVAKGEEPPTPHRSQLYQTPTYAQIDRLITVVKEGGGGTTGSVTKAMFGSATNALWGAVGAVSVDLATATNDLWNAIGGEKTPGCARVLPPYLHYFRFGSSYEEDAKWYYDNVDDDPGSCSARRIGDTVERNYDWHYDSSITAVIEVERGPGRLASLGVASVGTNLTEETVSSGEWSRFYKCLPGRTLDGINEAGVMIEMNVVVTNGSAWETGEAAGAHDVNGRYATRWALDRFETAAEAASNIADRAFMPRSLMRMGYALHYLVCDAKDTYLVEDGEAVRLTNAVPVMTNFRIRGGVSYGDGFERYEILTNAANSITNAWFTRAYDPETSPKWLSEFGGSEQLLEQAQELWARGDRESHRGESYAGQQWWQTVHTAVYDVSNLTLRVAVQERDDWYVFQAPRAGGTDEAEVRQIASDVVSPVDAKATAAKSAADEAKAMISPLNSTFSAAVLAVSVDFDYDTVTNAVAAIADFRDAFKGIEPSYVIGGSAGLGALVLALIGAVTWLKKNAATKKSLQGMVFDANSDADMLRLLCEVGRQLGATIDHFNADTDTGADLVVKYGLDPQDNTTTFSQAVEAAGLSDSDTIDSL